MEDFDINLIREFSTRPGLYDRSNAFYKDKLYINKAWSDISKILEVDVNSLKDRMLQLRNRYNLESRRIEELRVKYPYRLIRSQWPLFKHMEFMNGHIKHRRSFNKLKTQLYPIRTEDTSRIRNPPPLKPRKDNNNLPVNGDNSMVSMGKFVNNEEQMEINEDDPTSVLHIEHENSINLDEETQIESFAGQQNEEINHNFNESATNRQVRHMQYIQIPPNILQRSSLASFNLNEKEKRRENRLEKFESFGKFLAICLSDMPEPKAMKLVEKFTKDLASSLLENACYNNDCVNESSIADINKNSERQNAETTIRPSEIPEKKHDLLENNEDRNICGVNSSNHPYLLNSFEAIDYEDDEEEHITYDLTEDEPNKDDLSPSSV